MEGPIGGSCPADKGCLKWVEVYLKDCVCGRRDQVSLALGLASVISWGVAEVPHILTNFKEKSTEGVSLAFLITWFVGDLFNVAGCYLEPATLPTQFYMALLYTITTTILVGQTVYYNYVYEWLRRRKSSADGLPQAKGADTEAPKYIPQEAAPATIRVPSSTRDLYFMSARSLASSHTPTVGSYSLGGSYGNGGSHDPAGSYLLGPNSLSALHAGPSRGGGGGRKSSGSSIMRLAAASGTLVVGSMGLSSHLRRSMAPPGLITMVLGDDLSVKGEVLGWIMAAIYMGGRVPQIWLNMQQGTVEGLNPLMFMFAFVGNLTYIGSILVRSLEWARLKPNLPWLVDAAVCVLLDCVILYQFGHYFYTKRAREADLERDECRGGGGHDYKPLERPERPRP